MWCTLGISSVSSLKGSSAKRVGSIFGNDKDGAYKMVVCFGGLYKPKRSSKVFEVGFTWYGGDSTCLVTGFKVFILIMGYTRLG